MRHNWAAAPKYSRCPWRLHLSPQTYRASTAKDHEPWRRWYMWYNQGICRWMYYGRLCSGGATLIWTNSQCCSRGATLTWMKSKGCSRGAILACMESQVCSRGATLPCTTKTRLNYISTSSENECCQCKCDCNFDLLQQLVRAAR